MADLLAPEKLNLFLFFVVPGFVSLKVYDLMVPSARRDFSASIIEVISFSMINFAAWYWLIDLSNRNDLRIDAPVFYYLTMSLVLLVSPTLLAIVGYWFLGSNFLRGRVVHPTPMSWDFLFKQGRSYWLLFHLKSGQKLGGFYSSNSFASSFPHSQEVYVEQLWRVDANGRFLEKADRTAGAVIRADECMLIELFTTRSDHA